MIEDDKVSILYEIFEGTHLKFTVSAGPQPGFSEGGLHGCLICMYA